MKKYSSRPFLIVLFLIVLIIPIATWAINSLNEGWRVVNGAGATTINVHSDCQTVTNTSGTDVFVPTKTDAEWQAFQSHLPSNVALGICPSGSDTYTTAGTHSWTAPAGVTSVTVSMMGGGGGGGGAGFFNTRVPGTPGGQSSFNGSTVTASGGEAGVTPPAATICGTGGAGGATGGGAGGDGCTPPKPGTAGSTGPGGCTGGAGGEGHPTVGIGGGGGGAGGGHSMISIATGGRDYNGVHDAYDGDGGLGYGAGGGGANGENTGSGPGAGGGGGGRGTYVSQTVSVTPGQTYAIVVGAGGVGGHIRFYGGNGAQGYVSIFW